MKTALLVLAASAALAALVPHFIPAQEKEKTPGAQPYASLWGAKSKVKEKGYFLIGFFVIPRTDRSIVLEEDVQNLLGKPPVWKERARFEPKPVK